MRTVTSKAGVAWGCSTCTKGFSFQRSSRSTEKYKGSSLNSQKAFYKSHDKSCNTLVICVVNYTRMQLLKLSRSKLTLFREIRKSLR